MTPTAAAYQPDNLVIRASAGTGKTFCLTNRFIELLAAGEAVDRILATTFTRKAAGEILNRVLFRLAKAATDEAARSQLNQHLHCGPLEESACQALLEKAVRHLHRMRVGTLDSFFAQIAGTFSLELGLPPGWRICDEIEDERLRTEAVEAVLRESGTQELLRLTHLLTKGEARRGVQQLIRSLVDNLYSLYLETSEEVWRKVPKPKPLSDREIAAAQEELRQAPLPDDKRLRKARDGDLQRAAEGDWEQWIGKGLARPVLDGSCKYYGKPIPDETVAIYQRLVRHAKAEIVSRIAFQTEGTYQLLHQFHQQYQRLKTGRGALRFEDVTYYLARSPWAGGVDRLAFRLDGGVDHLLLDEFQDTSLTQWQVVRPFAERTTAVAERSFFCVGDVKQAIYGWRGGVAEIFDDLPDQLRHLTTGELNVSYRSAQPIIDIVNAVFTGINRHASLDRAQAAVRRWCDRFEPHSTARTELPGYACLRTSPEPDEGEKPGSAVLRFTANQVADLAQQAPQASIGVLVRTNDAVAQLIYLLRKRHVNASEEGGNPLTDSAAVRIILSLLTLSDHPGDTVARTHVLHSPLGKAVGLDQTQPDTAVNVAQRVRQTLLQTGYGPAIYTWSRLLTPHCTRREASRLTQLVETAYGYQAAATLRPSDFVRFVQTQRVSDPTAANVRVMTVHQSKGLQFDVVFLPDLDADIIGQPDAFVVDRERATSPIRSVCLYVNEQTRKLLPESAQKMFQDAADREVAESLCVLYVAMTRAVQALHMIIAPSKANEKKLRRSFAGLLRAALTDGRPAPADSILSQMGDPNWLRQTGHLQPVGAAKEAGPAEAPSGPGPVLLAPVTDRVRGLERVSPSEQEGGPRVRISAAVRSIDKERTALRGTLWHRWFECIEWLEEDLPDEDALRQAAAEFPEAATLLNVPQQLQDFVSLLKGPHLETVLRRGQYQPPAGLKLPAAAQQQLAAGDLALKVQTERRFAVREGGRLLAGAIDRLVVMGPPEAPLAADVTDYKTDALTRGDRTALRQRVEHYRPQLAEYCRAVSRFTRLAPDRIAARLVFAVPGEVVDL